MASDIVDRLRVVKGGELAVTVPIAQDLLAQAIAEIERLRESRDPIAASEAIALAMLANSW
jgi:hypothetical protein